MATRAASGARASRAEKKRLAQMARLAELLEHERALWGAGTRLIAGLDEAGAGPLAGPVVAACVVLDPARTDALLGVDDSKKLTAEARDTLARIIKENVAGWAIASATVAEIEEINILQAALLAMRRALDAVTAKLGAVEHLFIDARTLDHPLPQTPLIKGDARSLSIAAASILAKTARDAEMDGLGARYPEYGFERHKGYGTAEHLAALKKHGILPVHRRTFEPISTMLKQRSLFPDEGAAGEPPW